MSASKPKAFIGCSGFSYDHWKGGVFYPEGLAQKRMLEYYAGHFDTVELNVTFYRLPADTVFRSWRNRTPEGFRFVCKGSRLITHIKGLKGVGELVGQFMERSAGLEEKRGPTLWQMKPGTAPDLDLLKAFIRTLQKFPGTRHAFEFRHPGWFEGKVYSLLAKAGMTVCRADQPRNLPDPQPDFPFIYVRRHGPEARAYRGSYSEDQLRKDARDIRTWLKAKKDVYIYFNNDIGGHAPHNALRLKELIQRKK
jgi:uncharacterized protein YecE (DUF72 family)